MKKTVCYFISMLFFVIILSVNYVLAYGQQSESESVVGENKFIADGIILNDEYGNQVSYQNLTIFWNIEDNYFYMALKGKTTGYISIGIQPGSMMKDSDMILGYVKDGKVEIFDQYSTGDFGPHPSDEQLGGTNDIVEFGGKEEDGYTVIEFKRLLNTEDEFDLELKSGKNKIIWAYSNQDDIKARHTARGYGEIEIKVQE